MEKNGIENTIWYEIFPDRFNRGDLISSNTLCNWKKDTPTFYNFFGGNIPGIIDKLDYLKELGITGIYLTPVFESSSNHKYDTKDYYKVDKNFGDMNLLKRLISQAHNLEMKVMLDGVFNHSGTEHPFWKDILKKQEDSKYVDYYIIHTFPVKESYQEKEIIDYETFANFSQMPKWNLKNPIVRKYLIDIATYWIKECNIDGWRLDVASELSEEFLNELRAEIRKIKQDFYLVGEIWDDATSLINQGYFDATTNYPLAKLINEFLVDNKINAQKFTTNLQSLLSKTNKQHRKIAFNLLDSHDTVRTLTLGENNKTKLKNAFLMLFVLPGSPMIYYGTEIGMQGGTDPDCRCPMIWDKSKQDLALYEYFQKLILFRKNYLEIINNAKITYEPKNSLDIWKFQSMEETLLMIYNPSETVNEISINQNQKIIFSTDSHFSANKINANTIIILKS